MSDSRLLADLHSPSRYADLNGWRSFVTPLLLPGWEERSVWGLDQCHCEFFACLWPNGNDRPLRVTDYDCGCPRGRSPGAIVSAVYDEIGTGPLRTIGAMGLVNPLVDLRPDDEIRDRVAVQQAKPIADDYRRGTVDALRWVLGEHGSAPSAVRDDADTPITSARAQAESHLLEGRAYDPGRTDEQGFAMGGATALRWALGDEFMP